MTTMLSSDLPLPKIGRGKVRDIYAVDDDRLLLVTTDRISAFDVVMGETIETGEVMPNDEPAITRAVKSRSEIIGKSPAP